MASVKEVNSGKSKNTPLSKQCLGMMTKPPKKAEIERTRRVALKGATSGVQRRRFHRAAARELPK
jgi:hypothetical protein